MSHTKCSVAQSKLQCVTVRDGGGEERGWSCQVFFKELAMLDVLKSRIREADFVQLECRIQALKGNSRDEIRKGGQKQVMKGFQMVQKFGFNSV